jgi:hypothetical protein
MGDEIVTMGCFLDTHEITLEPIWKIIDQFSLIKGQFFWSFFVFSLIYPTLNHFFLLRVARNLPIIIINPQSCNAQVSNVKT